MANSNGNNRNIGTIPVKKPKYKKSILNIWGHKQIYLMLLPALIFFIIFSYTPMAGMVLAFKEFRFDTSIFGGDWVGLKYFERFFNDPKSWLYIKNTLIISSLKLFLYLPLPIILALLFKEIRSDKMRGFFQSISYLPHFLSWVVIVGVLQRILAPDTGLINEVIKLFGGEGSTFFMMEEQFFYQIMFSSFVWQGVGWGSIIYFAAISGISEELYEAAKIDGASRLKQIWHITLPGIRPAIIILFILSLGDILSAGFDQIYLLQTPGNAELAEILDTYIIRVGLQGGQFGYATAVGMMQGLIGLILVLLVNYVCNRKFDTSLF